jgi:AraC-like DNA-binding protein
MQIVFYVGAIQGLLLSIALFSLKRNAFSNRLLGFLTSSWAILLLVFALQGDGLYIKYPHLYLVFDQLFFLIFPLLYLHAKYLLSSQSKFRKRDLLHFLPFVLSIIAHIAFFLESGENKIFLIDNPTIYIRILEISANEIVAIQGFVYSILTLYLLKKYKLIIKDYEAKPIKKRIYLLQIAVIIILLSWIIGIIGLHLDYIGIHLNFDYFSFSYLALVLIIYIISFASLGSMEIFKVEMSSLNIKDDLKKPFFITDQSGKVSDDSIDDPLSSDLNDQLIAFMEKDKPYLNPELNLIDLAKDLNINRNELSHIINTFHEKNFYEFVNHYRVNEVKRLMKEKNDENYKMISYAYEAGFNSKASFYRIFKQFTDKTPSEYFNSL